MNKLDKKYLIQYIENLQKAIEDLRMAHVPIKFSLQYFDKGIPVNIVGHLAQSIGGFTKEKQGLSFYDYLEHSTGLMPAEITELNRCKTTSAAADYLENIVYNEYMVKLNGTK